MRRPKILIVSLLALGASLGSLLGLTACYSNVASNSPGDPPADAGTPNPLGGGLRLSEVVPYTETDGAPNPVHPAADAGVYVTGVSLSTIDQFDETRDGKSIGAVYVQDVWPATGPKADMAPANSGIQLYSPTYSPPNLLIAPGDVLDMTGLYQDYAYAGFPTYPTWPGSPQASQPEIYKPIVTFRFEYTAPVPRLIQLDDLMNAQSDYASFLKGHQWLSMLVEVDNVNVLLSSPDGKGRMTISLTNSPVTGPAISNELYNVNPAELGCPDPGAFPYLGGPCVGGKATLKKLIGVVTYFYSFHIAPRSAADLVH